MRHRVLPLLTALAFAAGAVNAFRLPPLTVWGDVYDHVPNHLVTAGMALLVAGSLFAVRGLATTPRARRAAARAAVAWALVCSAFVVDAVGGGIGDRTGDFRLHDAAGLLLPVVGLLLLVSSVLLVARWTSWALRVAAVASVPGTLALNQASSAGWLVAGLVAAVAWLWVAVRPTGRAVRTAVPGHVPVAAGAAPS